MKGVGVVSWNTNMNICFSMLLSFAYITSLQIFLSRAANKSVWVRLCVCVCVCVLFNRGNIEMTNSSKNCFMFDSLCMYVLFYVCVGSGYLSSKFSHT